jgi:hypothetical protein
VTILSAIVLQMVGCYEGPPASKNKPKTDTTVNQPATPLIAAPVIPLSSPATPTAVAEQPPVAKPAKPELSTPMTTPQPAPSAPSTSSQPMMRLSTGVALPQTGPNGTLMSFSVEYEYVQGEPASSGDVWVIERVHGEPTRQNVTLSKQGDRRLYVLIDGWQPENGPFHAHLEDANGNRISDSIELH